jgi:effector-binding domain-containing protein
MWPDWSARIGDELLTYEIFTQVATARPIAAVRRRVHPGQVATAWRPALDQVWAVLRRHEGLQTDGHNIFVYHHPMRSGEPIDIDFGVEVTGAFEDEGEVVLTRTPAGQVVSTLHVGPYDTLGDAHEAIDAWRAAHGRTFGPASWEIYGDWSDDPAKLEVEVVYLLA